jgi:hypothetical protein
MLIYNYYLKIKAMKPVLTILIIFCLGIMNLAAQIDTDVRFSDLPPNPEYGKCYAKCKTPDTYEIFTRKVLVEEAYVNTTKIPAVYETVTRKVMMKEGGVNYKKVAATYKNVTNKVMIEPERTVVSIIPAKYETRTRKVMVKEASGQWVKKKKDPNCFSKNPDDCLIACYEKIPAQYTTETYEVEIAPKKTVEKVIPAVYKTVTTQVVDEPEKTIEIPYDPVYKTVREKVMVTPEQIKEEAVPAIYKEVEEKRLTSRGGYTVWEEILCADKTSKSTVRKLQRALRARGYSIGAVDGVIGSKTKIALKSFQADHELPVGNLNIKTLELLEIPYQ